MKVVLAVPILLCLIGVPAAAKDAPGKACQEDVAHAVEQVGKHCKVLLQTKRIKWKNRVAQQLIAESKKARTLEEHYEVLVKLVARLRDGHAGVIRKTEETQALAWPGVDLMAMPGVSLCRVGRKIHVKGVTPKAREAGVEPGVEVVKVDGTPASKWLEARADEIGEHSSFSTDQQALYFACHRGLGGPEGTKLELTLKTRDRKTASVVLTRTPDTPVPTAPVALPADVKQSGACRYAKTQAGWGYVHIGRIGSELPTALDTVLGELGNVPGLILDFRANGGGSTNHEALLGRFVMKGKKFERAKAYPIDSAGPNPYGGPVVVIVDAGVCSAGETASGMFKEDGRGYMIGETPTAGMSSRKTTIDLPSGLFGLFVSTHSNKARFQGSRGIEGIGMIPHETVEYDPEDLTTGKDTLIRRAEALLAKFPRGKVPYRPSQNGWKPN